MSSKKKQGFASLTPEKHREVSSKGGSASVPKGFATFDPITRSKKSSEAAKARWAKVKAEREASENK